MRLFGALADRLLLIGAILLAGAFPSFSTQYEQQLTASLRQAEQDIAPFQAIADRHHDGSLDALIAHHRQSPDPTFYEEGDAIEALVISRASLRTAQADMAGSLLSDLRQIALSRHPTIRSNALRQFKPSFEYRSESLLFSLIAGLVLWFAVSGPCRWFFGRSRPYRRPAR
ncbi:MAG: DUF2937 family protein [Pseudomonadota bacterium]